MTKKEKCKKKIVHKTEIFLTFDKTQVAVNKQLAFLFWKTCVVALIK